MGLGRRWGGQLVQLGQPHPASATCARRGCSPRQTGNLPPVSSFPSPRAMHTTIPQHIRHSIKPSHNAHNLATAQTPTLASSVASARVPGLPTPPALTRATHHSKRLFSLSEGASCAVESRSARAVARARPRESSLRAAPPTYAPPYAPLPRAPADSEPPRSRLKSPPRSFRPSGKVPF